MRLVLAAILGCAVALAGAARADVAVPEPTFDESTLYHDGKGRYLAVAPAKVMVKETRRLFSGPSLFWGNRTRFFSELYVFHGKGASEKLGPYQLRFYDNRFPAVGATSRADRRIQGVDVVPGKRAILRCGSVERTFVPVAKGEIAKVRARAKLRALKPARIPYFLARDDGGRYYYVDRAADSKRLFDRRLYVGRRGQMKRVKLRDVADDTAGMLLVGKRGSLKTGPFDKGTKRTFARWLVKGKPVVALTELALITLNLAFVYDDLGVYLRSKSGTPCDWL